MFIGHIGTGLILKKIEPKINLGLIFFASLFLDFLLGIFALIGFEKIIIPSNYEHLHYLNFIFPYSHSFLAGTGWAFIVFCVTWIFWDRKNTKSIPKASFTMSAAVLLHWIGDWIEHPPQLPFSSSNSKQLGLGLWNNLEFALTLEVLLMITGLTLYFRITQNINRKGKWGILILMCLLTPIAILGQLTVEQKPEPFAVAISIVVQILVIAGIATVLDRNKNKTHQEQKVAG